MTVEGDKFPVVGSFTLGKDVGDMQQGVVWPAPELIISVSLVSEVWALANGESKCFYRVAHTSTFSNWNKHAPMLFSFRVCVCVCVCVSHPLLVCCVCVCVCL